MFERFHQDAREAVVRAMDEACDMGQPVRVEHLLLALLPGPGVAADALAAAGADAADLRLRIARGPGDEGGGPDALDADALASIGIDLDAVRRASDAAFGRGSLDRVAASRRGRGLTGGKRMTKDAKHALQLALRSAIGLHARHVSSGNVLLGLLDQPASPAAGLLREAGIDVGRLREDVVTRMSDAA